MSRVVLVGHDNFGSREICTRIIDAFPDVEFLLVITQGIYYKKSFFASVLKLLREASFWFCAHTCLQMVRYKLAGNTLEKAAARRGVRIHKSWNVNADPTLGLIRDFAPDLLVSTFTMHIHGKTIIDLPKVASVQVHPAILPDYRGLEVFFWAMANGETESGVSVFFLDTKIDAGRVIAQERFAITPEDTVESVYRKLTAISGDLLLSVIRTFQSGGAFPAIDSSGKGRYFPMPTPECYRRFKAAGRRFS